ncbi:MAG: hypothetical protein H7337_01980 [Rhizobacter sp.]|nr:hypothetical protein [Rhizobacter sp.]
MALRDGPLTLQRGKLPHIGCGAHEIWHGVALAFRNADWNREGMGELLLANLTGAPVDIHMGGWAASARASTLDAHSLPRLGGRPVHIVGLPHSFGSRPI